MQISPIEFRFGQIQMTLLRKSWDTVWRLNLAKYVNWYLARIGHRQVRSFFRFQDSIINMSRRRLFSSYRCMYKRHCILILSDCKKNVVIDLQSAVSKVNHEEDTLVGHRLWPLRYGDISRGVHILQQAQRGLQMYVERTGKECYNGTVE